MLRDVPPRARGYIVCVIVLGALTFGFVARATFEPLLPLLFLVLLSSLTSAFKVHFPIASGSNMSVSYVVDIAAIILRGPHAAMIVGAASGWSQSTLNARERNPAYRTLFNMACLVMTVEASGQVYQRLGGTAQALAGNLSTVAVATSGMALTYFFVNTVPIAVAIALTTEQSFWRIWKSDFASSAPSYVFGAIAAVVVIAVTETSGYPLTLLLAAAPLYLTYKMYRTGAESEARQGAILEAAHDAIITMDQDLNIREFNSAAEAMFGHKRMNILGRNVGELLPAPERALQLAAFRRYVSKGDGPLAARQIEMTAMREDGSEFPMELTVSRLTGDSRATVTGFVRDLTERRALEERLRQSQKLEAIGRLAGGVAHDFNNILMSIMGSADLLLMQVPRGDPAGDEITEIKESVRRGAALTRQLLAFSRRQATSPRLFELNDIIGGMDTMLRRLVGPEIEFVVTRSSRSMTVRADPAQIEQVVLNLVVNARDAMPSGGRLTVQLEELDIEEGSGPLADVEGRTGQYARLSVSDTGTGIDDKTRARLFEPFFTTKEQDKGTGLGLSIVYGIVKQSGGHIAVKSELGHGSSFLIYLPLATLPEPTPALA